MESLTVTTSAPFPPLPSFLGAGHREWEQKVVAEKEYKIYNFGNQKQELLNIRSQDLVWKSKEADY